MGNKVIFRTDRWTDYLSRETRGMGIAEVGDSVSLKFQDEVFSRLFTGDEPMPGAEYPDQRFGPWAGAIHAALAQSPSWARIVEQVKGSALRSAIAIDAVLKNVKLEPQASNPPPQGGEDGEGGQPGEEQGEEEGEEGGSGEPGEGEGEEDGEGGESQEGEEEAGEGEGAGEDGEPGEEEGQGGGGSAGEEGEEEAGEEGGGGGEEEGEEGEGEGSEEPGDEEEGEPGEGEEQEGEPQGNEGGSPGASGNPNSYGTGESAGSESRMGPPPKIDTSKLEEMLSCAAKEAEEEMDAAEEVLAGMAGAGVTVDDAGEVKPKDVPWLRQFAKDLGSNHKLKAIVDLAGKFKRIAKMKRAAKMVGGNEQTIGVEAGRDVMKLLPTELARLADDDLSDSFFSDYAENRTLQFVKQSKLQQGHGPVVMVLDKSGSMGGSRDVWQSAIALAMLDHAKRQRRTFALMGFGAKVMFKVIVKPNEPLPIDKINRPANASGTDIAEALDEALKLIAAERKSGKKLGKADIILITDGASSTYHAREIRREAERLDVSIIAIGIGVDARALDPWTNDARAVSAEIVADGTLDENLAGALFAPKAPNAANERKEK